MIWFRIGMMVLMLTLAGGVYWHYTHTMAENKRLQAALLDANNTILAQDHLLKRREEIAREERDLIDEIESTPAEMDAPTAPVLSDAIRRLQ